MKELNFLMLKNKMRKLLLILLITTSSFAQNANRKFISLTQKDGVATIKTSDGDYLIHFLSNKIVENSFIPKGEINNLKSEAVVLKNIPYKFQILKNGNFLSFGSDYITVLINKSPFQITYKDNSNLTLLSEKSGFTKVNDSTETLSFNLDKSEALYGGGARALGMNRRGNRLQLYNRAHYGYQTEAELMNFCIPLVMSSKLYAVHFDNSAIGYLDLDSKKDNTLIYETISGRKTYQVIVGDNWTDLVSNDNLIRFSARNGFKLYRFNWKTTFITALGFG